MTRFWLWSCLIHFWTLWNHAFVYFWLVKLKKAEKRNAGTISWSEPSDLAAVQIYRLYFNNSAGDLGCHGSHCATPKGLLREASNGDVCTMLFNSEQFWKYPKTLLDMTWPTPYWSWNPYSIDMMDKPSKDWDMICPSIYPIFTPKDTED